MTDLAAGFGIALVLEGLLWALAPDRRSVWSLKWQTCLKANFALSPGLWWLRAVLWSASRGASGPFSPFCQTYPRPPGPCYDALVDGLMPRR